MPTGRRRRRKPAGACCRRPLDLGITHFDSAALYGFGRNEELVGPFLKPHRDKVFLVSKCGMRGENGVRTIDGRPEKLRQDIEDSLRRLQTDVIDLYYLHRFDKVTPTPLEDSVGMLSRFVEEGKVRHIGLSETSAETIRKAHAIHPLAAVQSEYSLWSRNVEMGVLHTCAQLGIAFVAFSPLGRGFLTGTDLQPAEFTDKDIRRNMPRFQDPHFSRNRRLAGRIPRACLRGGLHSGATGPGLGIGSGGRHVHVIPGTTSPQHLEEDMDALNIEIPAGLADALDDLIKPGYGQRRPPTRPQYRRSSIRNSCRRRLLDKTAQSFNHGRKR